MTTITDLPTLTGTEKQVAWATDIRAACLAKWAGVIDELAVDFPRARNVMLVGVIRQIVDTLSQVADASVWIDGRSDAGAMMRQIGTMREDTAVAAGFGIDGRELRNIYVMMR